MNRDLGLKILAQIMSWSDAQAREEFRWLSFMSAYKYDGYREYLSGVRFIESLATWLQQFDQSDREIAYKYIKDYLIFIGPAETQRLVENFFPETVQKDLQEKVSLHLSVPKYLVWATATSQRSFQSELRKTLFMGLSDGARLDVLRRANAGVISNEQVAITTEINVAKWKDLLSELQRDTLMEGSSSAKFSRVYLIDDFTASGTSLIREDPIGSGNYKGKLMKFATALSDAVRRLEGNHPFEHKFQVTVHHYIGTLQAKESIDRRYSEAKAAFEAEGLFDVRFSYGMLLPDCIRLMESSGHPFANVCTRYYDHKIFDKHFEKSGSTDGKFGYAACGLPVILEHNTPNNSLSILWAETKGDAGAHPMRPLFRRRQRHQEFSA